jgi:hypothetical protein
LGVGFSPQSFGFEFLLILYQIRCRRSGTGVDSSPSFFSFPLIIIIPPLFHTNVPQLPEVSDSSDQAAHYPGLSVGGFISDLALGCLQSQEVSFGETENIMPPFLHIHLSQPMGCAIALTRQHIITSPVFNLGASSLTQHWYGRSVG